jgi:hypothetical protein
MSTHKAPFSGIPRILGTPLLHGRPTATFGRGRICSVEGCTTNLSLYNPNTTCSVHDHPLY